MTRSKKEAQLKENERYPLRSLTTDARVKFLHEEDLAEKREKAAEKRKEDKREEKAEAKAATAKKEADKKEAAKNYEVSPKEKSSWRR